MEYKLQESCLKSIDIPALKKARRNFAIVGTTGIAISIALVVFVSQQWWPLLCFALLTCPFIIAVPRYTIGKQIAEGTQLLNGQYRIEHKTVLHKTYDKIEELQEDEDEEDNDAKITLQDDNGNTKEYSPYDFWISDADVGDEFFFVYLDNGNLYTILTKKEFYKTN